MRRMKGFVNYYVDEDEENYRVVRGDKDVYKFKLDKTKVSLMQKIRIPLILSTQVDIVAQSCLLSPNSN